MNITNSLQFSAVKPEILVKFTSVENNQYEVTGGDTTGDILRIKTSKNINDVAGLWEIDLVGRKEFKQLFKPIALTKSAGGRLSHLKLFRPMSLVDIYINGNEVMLGTVDSVDKSVTIGKDGKPTVILKLKGRDLGGILMDQKIWYDKNPESSADRQNTSLVAGYLLFNNFPVYSYAFQIMVEIYDRWFSKVLEKSLTDFRGERVVPFTWSNGKKISDLLTCTQKRDIGGLSISAYTDFYNINFTNWSFEGSIFDCLKQFSGPPFNELFVDTGDTVVSLHRDGEPEGALDPTYVQEKLPKGKCHVIFRPTPFNDETIIKPESFDVVNKLDIADLFGHVISDFDIVDKNLGMSRKEMYSIYMVHPKANLIDVSSSQYFIPPLYDSVALNKYGHNPFDVKLGGWDASKNLSFETEGESLQKLAKSWFMNNDRYLNGYFKIKGRSEIRIGHRLDYIAEGNMDDEEEEGYYYITAVDQEWSFGREYTTRVGVKRGTSNILKKFFEKKVINTSSTKK